MQIDLNCDLGEYEEVTNNHTDTAIMPYISSCNIACGFHAGNQSVVEFTVKSAIKQQVSIGAHPSFPDRANFGRAAMNLPDHELKPMIIEQIMMISDAAKLQGSSLSHVKPHGALYNQAAEDLDLALLIMESVAAVDNKIKVYGLAHSAMATAGQQTGIQFIAEGFADRAYSPNRSLVPRNLPGSVITDQQVMLGRALMMLNQQKISTIDGGTTALTIKTLCIHGDHHGAETTAGILHAGLIAAGYSIKPPD